MAKKNKSNRKQTNSKSAASPEKSWGGATVVVALIGLLGTFGGTWGGMLLQDHLDLLRTQRELVQTFANAAAESEKSVETIVRTIAMELRDPNSRITIDQRADLRDALLDLQGDVERLSIQIGSVEAQYQSYARAMADLANAADLTDGAENAEFFAEALSSFYLNQLQFRSDISAMHRPSST